MKILIVPCSIISPHIRLTCSVIGVLKHDFQKLVLARSAAQSEARASFPREQERSWFSLRDFPVSGAWICANSAGLGLYY